MNKKINKRLNIIESVSLLVGIVCMLIGATLHHSSNISGIEIYNTLLFFVGVFAEIVVVSIELFLYYLMEFKYKFFETFYYILELVLSVWINSFAPFAVIIVLTVLHTIKNVFRILAVEKVYRFAGFYDVCMKFGIKTEKPKRKRKAASKTKSARSKAKNTNPVDAATSKSFA